MDGLYTVCNIDVAGYTYSNESRDSTWSYKPDLARSVVNRKEKTKKVKGKERKKENRNKSSRNNVISMIFIDWKVYVTAVWELCLSWNAVCRVIFVGYNNYVLHTIMFLHQWYVTALSHSVKVLRPMGAKPYIHRLRLNLYYTYMKFQWWKCFHYF